MVRSFALFLALVAGAKAECPNACSGNGVCSAYDMCTCYRNFQGADCSERTCPFGIAHVDSPKGDLDMSADSLTTSTVISGSTVYPYGTEELFPMMADTDGNVQSQTAHYYMECSNKGLCDRKSGECECFDGYEGSSCQRASCPEGCSGHGTCEHIEDLAGDVPYALWDTGMTMGCKCDPGYTGADCSGKACKYGIDPLYVDDDATARVSEQWYTIGGGNHTYPNDVVTGTYAIKFYDVFGEDYLTEPIKINTDSIISGEGCTDIVTALEGLPNTVIPASSVVCSATQYYKTTAQTYSLTFTGNPGYLKPLTIDTYLDGHRETVKPTGNGVTTVTTTNKGVSGEFVDYFASKCTGVTVQFALTQSTKFNFGASQNTAVYSTYYSYELNSNYYLNVGGGSADQEALLKKCLGDSDGNDSYGNNVEVYDWDYGSYFIKPLFETAGSHPHAIKLVSTDASDDYVGGKYYLTWYQSLTTKFIIVNPPVADTSTTSSYYVYTTDGVVERVIVDVAGEGQMTTRGIELYQPPVTAYFEQYSNVMYTSYDVACETAISIVEPCLDKGDMLFVVDTSNLAYYQNFTLTAPSMTQAVYSPTYEADSGDLYTITKIYKEDPTDTTYTDTGHEDRFRIVLDKNIPFAGTSTTTNTNWGSDTTQYAKGVGFGARLGNTKVGVVGLFKFSPATTGNYEFVSECSNRGSCVDGVCECYKGYTKDDCATQSAYAV
jgi:hypothetical protein